MRDRSQQDAFTAFVAAHRPVLLGAAFLMYGTPERAEDVVSATLATLYGSWRTVADPGREALKGVLLAQPQQLRSSARSGERFELVDGGAGTLATGVVRDLARLSDQARRVVVLETYIGLPRQGIAGLLGLDEERVAELAAEGRARLTEQEPERADDGHLTEELTAAVGVSALVSDPDRDLANGRALVRRRTLRRASVAAALVIALVLGITQLIPARPPTQDTLAVAPTPARPAATCDTRQTTCQADVVRAWRQQMAEVTRSYVDPERDYFSGYTYSYDDLYDSQDFWRGRGGVLGFDLFRLNGGSTEVYVQIATSSKFAVPCGLRTRQRCSRMRFMDGNVFTLTDTTYADEGLEVQYSPEGNEVITVIARNTTKGKGLNVGRAELVSLVLDDRLRLPAV
jgi:DNA-directed RNA polymerase specialized sigma24 family protein